MTRNKQLAATLKSAPVKVNVVEARNVPAPDTKNLQGHAAYSLDKWTRLLTMLNTLKLQDQFYRTATETVDTLRKLIHECATEDAYFTAQCIVYSRTQKDGMRSINAVAAALLGQYISGQVWAKDFFGRWNKKEGKGGIVFRLDDMESIMLSWQALATGKKPGKLSNAMKKAFRKTLENMDSYSLLKYKKSVIDLANLVHPSAEVSKATVEVDGKTIKTLTAIMTGCAPAADTWEAANSEAGQIVAQAQREGKLTSQEAAQVIAEAKAENYHDLLKEGKLGILAAIRNIRNILKLADSKPEMIAMLADLISDPKKIREGLILPYQLDIANEILTSEFSLNTASARSLKTALEKAIELSVPNLAQALTGPTLVMVDMSGSMNTRILDASSSTGRKSFNSTALTKASLLAAIFAKGLNADIMRFGDSAEFVSYNPTQSVFDISRNMQKPMGGTSLRAAWDLAKRSNRNYTRVIILSDNECNIGSSYAGYTSYVESVGSPYVYSVDLAAYGTTAIAGPKVKYYYGYGFSMFDDMMRSEFDPKAHIEAIKAIKFA